MESAIACGGCGMKKDKLLTCSKCSRQRYCSQDCQRRDWPKVSKPPPQTLIILSIKASAARQLIAPRLNSLSTKSTLSFDC